MIALNKSDEEECPFLTDDRSNVALDGINAIFNTSKTD